MRKLTLLVAVAAVILSASQASAIRDRIGVFTWNYSLPVSDTGEFISNDSWLGASLEGRWFAQRDEASVGFILGWNEFYENVSETIQLPPRGNAGGAVTGDQYRNILAYPMLVSGQIYFGEQGGARPYLGLGVGAYHLRQFMDIGLYTIKANDWLFGMAPEFGILIPGSGYRDLMTVVNVRYHYPFEGGEFLGGKKSFSYWSIGVGLSWGP